ncbi:cytochrome P450 [Sistotremastrum suecicum HHB10207 ss-3]|uniref:Cytochrome P450 n=1 Tax=Sistotremastrum suecicum HHB10207 ss-3 TaxID=1314776 RepID=A0A166CAS5_9AGAM|nr:cytochrome P450 [Sistotremastrum suecicum HHB10207 ss-3]
MISRNATSSFFSLSIQPLSQLFFFNELLIAIALSIFVYWWRRRSSTPLPPGPRGSLLTGNRSNILGTKEIWKEYAAWGTYYGPVISVKSANVQVIILNSSKAAFDLLDKRSYIYSDRPQTAMFGDLVGLNKGTVRVNLRDPRFPAYRRVAHEEMGPRQMSHYEPAIQESIKLLLKASLSDPKNLYMHLRNLQGRSMMKTTYGYSVESDDDYYVGLAEGWMNVLKHHMKPGQWLVDSYPILKYVPGWMPGAGFKAFATERKAQLNEVLTAPFQWVKSEMAAGRANSSFVSRRLSGPEELNEFDEAIVKQMATSMYVAGIDTVPSVLSTFILNMVLNPDVQKRAQSELDSVVGSERLPRLSDKSNLPYVEALVKEAYRYHPPSPLGSPHCAHQDDVYEDMFIPKGSHVHANIWAITHDESIYPNPEKFDPTRYLVQDPKTCKTPPDPRTFIFGFGRRICSGMHVADAVIFLTIASTLATCNILKSKDEAGNVITPEIKFTGGNVSRPEDFPCRIVPRSDAAMDLMMWPH